MKENSKGSVLGGWLGSVRHAFSVEEGAIVAGVIADATLEVIPQELIAVVISHVNETFIKTPSIHRFTARVLSVPFGKESEKVEAVLLSIFSKLYEMSKKLTSDQDKNKELLQQLLKEMKSNDNDEEDDMAKAKIDPKAATLVVAAPASAPIAPPVPKDNDKTILQMVGEMSVEDQKKFWTLIGAVRAYLLNAPHDLKVEEFDRRLVRMTMPKAELILFINGVTTNVNDMQRDMFIRALQQSVSAGGVAGGFVRMLDHAQGALESVTSGAGNIRPDHLAKELREGNLRRERRERVLRRIR